MAVYKKGNYLGEKLLIDGPAGKLQVQCSYPEHFLQAHPLAVISHPHPLYGGNMSNKVVYNIARACNDLGYAAVRYNFRGVDQSQGNFDHGKGETDDLSAVVQFYRQRHPQSAIVLAGFSFGAYITAKAQSVLSPGGLILAAPPVSMYDFKHIIISDIPWMVLQGGNDEIVDAAQVAAWVEEQGNLSGYYYRQQADHFFHGEMDWLRGVITSSWMAAS